MHALNISEYLNAVLPISAGVQVVIDPEFSHCFKVITALDCGHEYVQLIPEAYVKNCALVGQSEKVCHLLFSGLINAFYSVDIPAQVRDLYFTYLRKYEEVKAPLHLCIPDSAPVDAPVLPFSVWTHYKGGLYIVIHILNEGNSVDDDNNPPMVFYADSKGKKYGRLLSRWHKSFTLSDRQPV